MSAAFHQDTPDEGFYVAVRKDKLDAQSPWWRQAYLRFIWTPFLRFSFKVFGIPAPNKMNPDGSFSFLEGIGIATEREIAEMMCKDNNYRWVRLPINASLPRETVQQEVRWPRAEKPDRYNPPTYPAVACSDLCATEIAIEQEIARVDRIRHNLKTRLPI